MSARKPSHIPLFPDAYHRDTTHLTTEEHGAYLLLLMAAWGSPDCSLPNDERRLAALAKLPVSRWRKIAPTVLEFWTIDRGRISQSRLTKEWNYVNRKRGIQSDNGSSRWASGDAREHRMTRSARLSEAREKGRHTAAEWGELVRALGNQCVRCRATGVPLVKDHIVPIYQGGSDGLDNLQPLCTPCNSSKGPDRTDYRKAVCHDIGQRLPNACQTPSERLHLGGGGGVGDNHQSREEEFLGDDDFKELRVIEGGAK